MGHYVSNMFGIRTGGVFSGKTDTDELKERISKLVLDARKKEKDDATYYWDLGDKSGDISHCMSRELVAHKGSYVVIAGVFNYWKYESASFFAKALSKEFCVEVMHMCWDEERNEVRCNIWLDGRQLFEVNENPIGNIIRRVC